MAEGPGHRDLRVAALERLAVRPAGQGTLDAHEHLALRRLWHGHLAHLDLAGLNQKGAAVPR
jgi:hypothetical protein